MGTDYQMGVPAEYLLCRCMRECHGVCNLLLGEVSPEKIPSFKANLLFTPKMSRKPASDPHR